MESSLCSNRFRLFSEQRRAKTGFSVFAARKMERDVREGGGGEGRNYSFRSFTRAIFDPRSFLRKSTETLATQTTGKGAG